MFVKNVLLLLLGRVGSLLSSIFCSNYFGLSYSGEHTGLGLGISGPINGYVVFHRLYMIYTS